MLADRRTPQRIPVNLTRRNVRSIRAVLNVGESVTEFVRVAAIGEVSRRRVADLEAVKE